MSSINAAIVARCAAALNAINAEFVIQAEGVPLAQSPVTSKSKEKQYTKPNNDRNRKWGYHEKVRAMTIGEPVAFELPSDEPDSMMDEFVSAVWGYAKHFHGASKKADWEVAVSARTLYLARLF